MKTLSTHRFAKIRLWTLGLLPTVGWLSSPAHGAGFTEPPVIFYGQINQTYNGYSVPVSSGRLSWTVQSTSAGSKPVVAATVPGLVANQSFYRLEIPVEKLPPGYTVSASAINTASATFSRGTVALDGTPVSIVYPTTPDRATFTFSETARGKMDHLDLALTTPFLDSDGDGLPDWFEDKYGLNKYDPSDAGTLDPYGRSYLDDYNNHVDPTASSSEYVTWATSNALQGTSADPMADVDHDGIPNVVEFALGTNPNVPDSALAAQRSLVQVETIDGTRYLTLTVQKPGRTSLAYKVESSSDLKNWSSAEGSSVVTVTNTASLLKVRAAKSVDATLGTPVFLRLRVLLNP